MTKFIFLLIVINFVFGLLVLFKVNEILFFDCFSVELRSSQPLALAFRQLAVFGGFFTDKLQ